MLFIAKDAIVSDDDVPSLITSIANTKTRFPLVYIVLEWRTFFNRIFPARCTVVFYEAYGDSYETVVLILTSPSS